MNAPAPTMRELEAELSQLESQLGAARRAAQALSRCGSQSAGLAAAHQRDLLDGQRARVLAKIAALRAAS